MSTVKISNLSQIFNLDSNTSNTLFVGVDIPSGVTGKITATTIAEGLYSHNPLNVGNNEILFPDTIAQFSGTSPDYLQMNLQNIDGDGSGDFVITANNGSDTQYFIDLGINGDTFSDSDYSSMDKNDGYLYVSGAPGDPSNLVLGTSTPGSEVVLIVGGTKYSNVVARFTEQYLRLNTNVSLVFSDATQQFTAASPVAFSEASFNKANTASSNTVYLLGALNQTNTNIVNANTQLKAYTDGKFLANTTGSFNGSLNVIGNITTNGTISITNPNIVGNSVFFRITGAANNASQPPSNPGYTIHTTSIDGQGNRITADAFGSAANNYASFIGRRGRGTAQNPTAVQSGDIIARFAGNGFGSSKFSQYGDGRIEIVANENFTDASKRTKIDFYTTESGSNTANVIATFNGNSAIFIGYVNPQKGFVYTPNVISSNVTSISIDITNNSLYKLRCNNNISISLDNFQEGKVVEMWLTNYSGLTRTVTHGCYATNSSTNSTTFNISATSSAYIKYFSMDGDLANTFVTIQYT